MLEEEDVEACQDWHELLDTLCTRQGHLDNMALAEHLCAAQGNHTQAAFDTAVKSLRNWRQGIHLPQRKNFLLLAEILEINRHERLRARWNGLYSAAISRRSSAGTTASESRTAEVKIGTETRKPASAPTAGRIATAAAGGLVALAVAGFFAGWVWQEDFIDPAASMEVILAEYVRNVSVQVGDAVIIHGARGNECGDAPSWESARVLLPELMTGKLSDGGIGTRYSRQCGGRVPARAILFIATTPGIEQTSLYGDEVHIRVTN